MDDSISRQAAIDALMPIYKTASTRNRNVFSVARKCLETIESLPSAKPKKGKWIDKNGGPHCNSCGEEAITEWNEIGGEWIKTPYCPFCGADLREEQKRGREKNSEGISERDPGTPE